MKLLFFTDTHIRGNNPKNRMDNYLESLKKKFNEIVEITNREKVDYVLHGGDIFDRPDISPSVVGDFIKILKKISVPIYLISGNHDIYGYNPKTISRTILGLLDTLELLKIIDNKYIILDDGKIRVQLSGQPYTFDIDGSNKMKYYSPKEKSPDIDYSIHMVHGMLLDKPFIKGIPFTLIDDIKNTKADIILSGHYHSGFKTRVIGGKYFINPGALVRISNSMEEIKRRPKVVILDLTEEIKIKEIYLNSAIDGELILNRESIEEFNYKRDKIIEFKQVIGESINFDKMNINDVLLEIASADNFQNEVREEALKRIAEIQMRDF